MSVNRQNINNPENSENIVSQKNNPDNNESKNNQSIANKTNIINYMEDNIQNESNTYNNNLNEKNFSQDNKHNNESEDNRTIAEKSNINNFMKDNKQDESNSYNNNLNEKNFSQDNKQNIKSNNNPTIISKIYIEDNKQNINITENKDTGENIKTNENKDTGENIKTNDKKQDNESKNKTVPKKINIRNIDTKIIDNSKINKNLHASLNKATHISRIPPQLEVQQLKQKLNRLELAMDISRQFSSTLDVDKLMQTILDRVANALNAEAGSFWIKEKHSNMAICHVAVGPAKNKVLGLKLKPGTGIVGWVIENKQKTVVFDTNLDDRFFNKVDEKTDFVTKSILCVPLLVNKECVGAISLLNKKTPVGQFNQQDVEMLELLAMNGAIAIKNAQLFQSERKIKELKTLLSISKEINSTLDLDRVLLAIVNLGTQVIFYQRALIGLLDINNKIKLSAETNVAQVDLTLAPNKKILNIMKYVLDSKKSLHITNFQIENPPKNIPQIVLDYIQNYDLKCLSVIIMKDSEGKLGLISMEGTYNSLVVKDSNYVIDIVVNQATVAIRNAQLYKNVPLKTFTGKLKTTVKKSTRSWKKIVLFIFILAILTISINSITILHKINAVVEIIPSHITKVTALIDGVVKDILIKEGDFVNKGQVIIFLDTSVLELERAKLENEININTGELRRLHIEGLPYEVSLKKLELEKLDNQLKYIDLQISNSKLVSTASGIVITQKPEQLINKQVIKGEVLTEIAVQNNKTAEIIIEEDDVLKVKLDSEVLITLYAFPNISIKGKLESISCVKSEPETEDETEGFKAWIKSAQLNDIPEIRFGMTGKAKIIAGKKTIYDIYLDPFFQRIYSSYKMKILENY